MFEAVQVVLSEYFAVFAMLEDLVLGHQRLKDAINLLKRLRQIQEPDRTGLTDTKTDLRKSLVAMILDLMAAIKSYANASKNKDLKSIVGYTETELNHKPDPVLYDIGKLVTDTATPLQPELAKYFLTPEKLENAVIQLDRFDESIPKKRVAISKSKASTENIKKVTRSTSDFLKEEVDVLVELFKTTNPDFYKAYRNARIIIDYGGRGKSEEDDEQEGKPGPV